MAFSRSPEENKEIYEGLRAKALAVKANDIGFQPNAEGPQPYGVLMDMSQPRAVVTLVSFITGDASLYFSSGGGMLGGIQHESVRRAAVELVALSQGFLPHFNQVTAFPGPAEGAIRFYIL